METQVQIDLRETHAGVWFKASYINSPLGKPAIVTLSIYEMATAAGSPHLAITITHFLCAYPSRRHPPLIHLAITEVPLKYRRSRHTTPCQPSNQEWRSERGSTFSPRSLKMQPIAIRWEQARLRMYFIRCLHIAVSLYQRLGL